MKRKKTLSIILFGFVFTAFAQVTAFKSGEKLSYSVSFNGSGVSANVMNVNMSVSSVNTKAGLMTKLYGEAITYSNFDRVFKVRDVFQSYVRPNNLEPYLHKRSTNEGGAQVDETYLFTKNGTVANIKTTKKGRVGKPDYPSRSSQKSVPINYKVKDFLGALYYVRNGPLSSVPVGKSIKLSVLFDGKLRNLSLTNQGVKTLKTALGTKKCYKFTTSAQGDNNSISGSIYFTADANKVPVLIEADIPVGKGQIKLTSASGLRN